MANLTLKVDDELLEKARLLASRRKTSLNAIVRRRLEEFVSSDLSRHTAIKGLESFYTRCEARVGRKTWTRDEIHDR
jgi:predicted transcriptional regulator